MQIISLTVEAFRICISFGGFLPPSPFKWGLFYCCWKKKQIIDDLCMALPTYAYLRVKHMRMWINIFIFWHWMNKNTDRLIPDSEKISNKHLWDTNIYASLSITHITNYNLLHRCHYQGRCTYLHGYNGYLVYRMLWHISLLYFSNFIRP